MKVCQRCGAEISTKDGENFCQECEQRKISRKKAAQRRREIDDAMESAGLVKVRGAMGGTYYE